LAIYLAYFQKLYNRTFHYIVYKVQYSDKNKKEELKKKKINIFLWNIDKAISDFLSLNETIG
jgi:hypothetical protein